MLEKEKKNIFLNWNEITETNLLKVYIREGI